MFGATKLFPWFVHILGFHGTFWMYGLVMLVEVGCLIIPLIFSTRCIDYITQITQIISDIRFNSRWSTLQ